MRIVQDLTVRLKLLLLKTIYKNKKIILYGAGKYFYKIFEQYNLKDLNIIAIADKKFINQTEDICNGLQAIPPDDIFIYKPDVILGTMLYDKPITKFLNENLGNNLSKMEYISFANMHSIENHFLFNILYKDHSYTGYSTKY